MSFCHFWSTSSWCMNRIVFVPLTRSPTPLASRPVRISICKEDRSIVFRAIVQKQILFVTVNRGEVGRQGGPCVVKSARSIGHPLYCYRSGRAHKVQLKVVFLILKYYLGLALCIDSYVVAFFLPLLLRQFLSCTLLTT